MSNIFSAIIDDINAYESLCRLYDEEVVYIDSGHTPDCYGEHAKMLKKRHKAQLDNAIPVLNTQAKQSSDDRIRKIVQVIKDELKANRGKPDALSALRKVGRYVRSVHCKDATWAAEGRRGQDWGAEVALGDADVGMEDYLSTLN